MQIYWKCEECDEVNAYPQVTVCETCLAPITDRARRKAVAEGKAEELRIKTLAEEEERKRKEKYLAEIEAEKAKQIAGIKKCLNFIRKCLSIAMISAVALATVIIAFVMTENIKAVDFDNELSNISTNIVTEYNAHTYNFAEKELNFDIDSLESAFAPAKRIFRNVCEKAYYRIEYLCDTYTPIENIKQLSDELTEYLVGGV